MKRLVILFVAILLCVNSSLAMAQEPVFPSEETIARRDLVLVALEKSPADLIIERVTMLDVHTLQWLPDHDIVIKGERIAWTGPHSAWNGEAAETINAMGLYAVPGFGESHNHIESTHLTPDYYNVLALPDGVTWGTESSHEFGNVTSEHNAKFWLECWKYDCPLKIYPLIGSAIPPTPFEFTGGYYGYDEMYATMSGDPRVVGLGEVMDWPAVWNPDHAGYSRIWEVIQATWDAGGVVEGHGSRMYDLNDINAFAAASLSSDHSTRECAEALYKVQRGVFLQLKPGALRTIGPCFAKLGITTFDNMSVTTDDRSALDSLELGTMDYNIRVAIESGFPVEAAYAMASNYPAKHHHIEKDVGSIAPGRKADVVLLSDPDTVKIEKVFASGQLVAERNGDEVELVVEIPVIPWPAWATDTMNVGRQIVAADFAIESDADIVTAAILSPFYFREDYPTIELATLDGVVQSTDGLAKFAIVDRYNGTGLVAKMFWQSVGPSTANVAVASSVAHDHHNIWVLGSSDDEMAIATNHLASIGGGWVLVADGQIIDEVLYEVGGLMSSRPPVVVANDLADFWDALAAYEWLGSGIPGIKRQIFATLTCQPWRWVLVAATPEHSSGFVNVTTGEYRPVVE
ncbi:MAG: adenine deaminase [Planctomycetaceae bacterium]|nr:adenine deaminase [Planctomycetaceae bacterium]